MRRKTHKFHFTLDEMGEFLAKFSEHSEQVYWISNPDFSKIQYVSPSYEKIWGRSRAELYKSPQKWLSYFHPDDATSHNPLDSMAEEIKLHGEKARYSANYRIVKPNGEVRWIKDSGFPLIDDEGVCYGVTGVAIDVTDEYKSTAKLKIARDTAEAANRAKDEFIRNMSHDIRTPLSGIIGMSSILEKEAQTLEEKELAHMVNISGERLLTLLNSVLDVIASGSQSENKVDKSLVCIQNLIHNIVELELPSIKLKNLGLLVTLADDLPELIETDAVKIHRILLNLLSNAVKFTEQGYIEIGAKLGNKNKTMQWVDLFIKDSGAGITEKDQKNMFKKFYRGTSSYQGIYSGHGVGLYIVKKYIQLLKGKITVESKPNEGAIFKISIPVKVIQQKSATSNSPTLSISEDTTFYESASALQVLLIEDNAIALKTAENILNSMGIGFQSAPNGAKAIELFSKEEFQLVLSDIGLPDISGIHLARHFRFMEKTLEKQPIPIIGLTAHSEQETRQEALQAGMNLVLNKPIRPEQVTDLIKKYNLQPDHKTTSISSPEIINIKTTKYDLPDHDNEMFQIEQFALFDEEEGIKNSGGLDALKDLLELLINSELPSDYKKMKDAFEHNNYPEVERCAHKIKGGAVYIGTTRMKFACQYLERYWKSGERKLFKQLYHQAISTIEETIIYIEGWLQKNTS
ncbi:PAS domain-containing hybrid sensor histidine kinase/response regulator [Legionella sp. km535]|uniref:PAS domain-containing hybrid sensor histidine kinase/response regulator n=1 Tax=Legionella sp. km535 TaxID=2498107 RepID=UPI000F8E5427|nr:PAS domain-containing hybrid sensor histidine kinase/response regulator [Legionella sp. km535]RUR20710.1 PAS domain-containing hybrid sensor histidine kinase/response regulator [Legionella sp. km535]